jgi:hypothetical protein
MSLYATDSLPQVFVGSDLPSYDLDGIGIAGFDNGDRVIQLMLGMAFAPFCVVLTDHEPGVWNLMQAPSIMLSRDEHEIVSRNVTFALEPVTFAVPADAPRLQLLKPHAVRDIRLKEIHFWAKQSPFRWFARITTEDGQELLCGPKGWSFEGQPVEFRIDLDVEVKHMKPRDKHLKPQSAADFLAGVRPEFPYVFARGQYSPDPAKSERCFLYYRASDHLVPVREAWLTPKEIKAVEERENVEGGECDAMYMPEPVLVWAASGERFALYRKQKLLLQISPNGVRIYRYPLRKYFFPRAEIRGIHAYLNHGWVECGLKLMLAKRELRLARNFEWAAAADPTYDGLYLLADTSWAVSLGRALSKAIGCDYVADKDLQ